MAKPSLLFYCQHSLGIGHLVRSFALVRALTRDFDVVFLNGGPLPENLQVPQGVRLIQLPALGMDENNQQVSRDGRYSVGDAKVLRKQVLLEAFTTFAPRVIVIELFPFGRKKFADEIVPLLEYARAQGPRRPTVVCSLRDLLVGDRRDQQRHDDRASDTINRFFDAVLVHSDSAFARLEESFHPTTPLTVSVHYTGFVTTLREAPAVRDREHRVLVSAGGGIVGMPLFEAALAAQPMLWQKHGLPMTLVAGPFLPEADWIALRTAALTVPALTLVRSVPDLGSEMRQVAISISQCGYNSAMDILAARVPALVVPYAEGREDEQINRARRLERLGLLQVLPATELSGESFSARVSELLHFKPSPLSLYTDGAAETATFLRGWSWRSYRPSPPSHTALEEHR